MRLIDADALVKTCIEGLNDDEVFDRIPPDYVDDAPTIDAVPVVRCKDCKHFMEFTETFRERIKFDGSCRLLVGFTECDREMRKYTDYCSSGAKMDLEV